MCDWKANIPSLCDWKSGGSCGSSLRSSEAKIRYSKDEKVVNCCLGDCKVIIKNTIDNCQIIRMLITYAD